MLGIALPSYRNHVMRVNRTEAVSALLEIAGCQETVIAMTGRFDTTRCIPESLEHYAIRMVPADETEALAYTAWADPTGAQARDNCGSLGLDQTGFRQVTGADAETGECWRAR